jgi:hypothetical protein
VTGRGTRRSARGVSDNSVSTTFSGSPWSGSSQPACHSRSRLCRSGSIGGIVLMALFSAAGLGCSAPGDASSTERLQGEALPPGDDGDVIGNRFTNIDSVRRLFFREGYVATRAYEDLRVSGHIWGLRGEIYVNPVTWESLAEFQEETGQVGEARPTRAGRFSPAVVSRATAKRYAAWKGHALVPSELLQLATSTGGRVRIGADECAYTRAIQCVRSSVEAGDVMRSIPLVTMDAEWVDDEMSSPEPGTLASDPGLWKWGELATGELAPESEASDPDRRAPFRCFIPLR